MFAPLFRDFPACQFVETTFQVDVSTLHTLATLYPLPEPLQNAVLKRQVEFLAGRSCARQAIAGLTGSTQAVIPQQSDRSPGWPPDLSVPLPIQWDMPQPWLPPIACMTVLALIVSGSYRQINSLCNAISVHRTNSTPCTPSVSLVP